MALVPRDLAVVRVRWRDRIAAASKRPLPVDRHAQNTMARTLGIGGEHPTKSARRSRSEDGERYPRPLPHRVADAHPIAGLLEHPRPGRTASSSTARPEATTPIRSPRRSSAAGYESGPPLHARIAASVHALIRRWGGGEDTMASKTTLTSDHALGARHVIVSWQAAPASARPDVRAEAKRNSCSRKVLGRTKWGDHRCAGRFVQTCMQQQRMDHRRAGRQIACAMRPDRRRFFSGCRGPAPLGVRGSAPLRRRPAPHGAGRTCAVRRSGPAP